MDFSDLKMKAIQVFREPGVSIPGGTLLGGNYVAPNGRLRREGTGSDCRLTTLRLSMRPSLRVEIGLTEAAKLTAQTISQASRDVNPVLTRVGIR